MVPANSWEKPELLEDGFPVFSSKSVKALQRILSATDASILLITSHKATYKISEWRNLLKSRNINPKKIKRLSSNSLYTSRKDEIIDWYEKMHSPNERFVIIDDDKMLNGLPESIKRNLILTSSSIGLTDDLADEAISILKNDYQ